MKRISIHNHFNEQGKYDNTGIAYYLPYTGANLNAEQKAKCVEIRVTDSKIFSASGRPVTIGLIYLTPIHGTNDVSLNFIEVNQNFQRQGISKLLVKALIVYLKKSNYDKLYRTMPGVRCPKQFTDYMTEQLDKNNIEWYNKK